MSMKKLLVAVFIVWAIVAMFGCVPMAIATHEALSLIGVESQIVEMTVNNATKYVHVAISINETIYEPRYLGLYRQTNIDYDNPHKVYNSTTECLDQMHFLPPLGKLFSDVIPEVIRIHVFDGRS